MTSSPHLSLSIANDPIITIYLSYPLKQYLTYSNPHGTTIIIVSNMPHQVPTFTDRAEQSNAGTRPSGSAGYASVEALATTENNASGRVFGTGTGGTVTAPGYSSGLNSDVLQNAESDRPMSKAEAERMYEERMEEEYAKREGGA
ncbi:uncharacterized protein ACLA_051480 [Aspergillus clavatus NRRL 1]|uniref:Uncharacterized protein n=1 Tax=Aspergillus clavatus (strain ATCC 1007 / CBS 513.65 / DSM 816 / NCTC 3887 / NRRL 1 / QM 1276 / 107) TaxID=344612 RepID=A1CIH1_ASPCL|nr:uncharacterized protein ACLA_051480 [Aspergillus clavatus NRRL 1]EAW10676.1 conserved hypothetical protein [Aspergillus clavatus NRRL 1]